MWDRIVAGWRTVTLFARLLFVCRVSCISGVGGVLLFNQVAQAQDLLADLSHGGTLGAISHWAKVLIGLALLWAFPVHYAARRALDDDGWVLRAAQRERLPASDAAYLASDLRTRHAFLLKWLPRALGLLPFLAMLAGLWQVYQNIGTIDLNEAHQTLYLIWGLAVLCCLTAGLFLVFVIFREPLIRRARARHHRHALKHPGHRSFDLFAALALICLLATVALFLLAYFAPITVSALMPRAALIPLLFGSLVLPLSFLGRLGHRHGVPYLLLLGLACALATGFNLHFNDLRVRPLAAGSAAGRQVDLADAVARWRAANGCAQPDTPCPPALIVAAEGGASRAAFMTATVVGAILDQSAAKGGSGGPGRRVFAISGVSGGAVGATLIRAALADAAEASDGQDRPPCRSVHRTWYRAPEFLTPKSLPNSWRECLQILAAGDFLSPTFVGLAFRDNFAPPVDLIAPRLRIVDRAVLIEEALERHYEFVTGTPRRSWTETGESCEEPGRGLCRLFGYHGGGNKAPPPAWLPLLALNGTSVQTGRRILTADVAATVTDKSGAPAPLYAQAYDLFEFMATPCQSPVPPENPERCPQPPPSDAPDLYLSTAAFTSARFPIISPAGIIEPIAADHRGDAVVDGGYFENGGVTTALDLARALAGLGVTPMILSIVNEPERTRQAEKTPPRQVTTPLIGPSDWHRVGAGLSRRMLGVLGAPIDTLLGTRGGHGAEARDRVTRLLPELARKRDPQPGPPGTDEPLFHTISLRDVDATADGLASARCPDHRIPLALPKLSMSWWLSAVVQADIDVQVLCTQHNRDTFSAMFRALQLDPILLP